MSQQRSLPRSKQFLWWNTWFHYGCAFLPQALWTTHTNTRWVDNGKAAENVSVHHGKAEGESGQGPSHWEELNCGPDLQKQDATIDKH